MQKELYWRMAVTIVLLIGLWLFSQAYERIRGPLEGAVAVHQLDEDNATYAAARAVATGDIVWIVRYVLVGIPLLIIWGSFVLRKKAQPQSENREVQNEIKQQ